MIPVVGSDYPKKVVPLLDSAKKNIDIIVYDWRWYHDQTGHPVQKFNAAVMRAVARGVRVRAICNAKLLLPILNKYGVQARQLKDHRTLHIKMIIVDDLFLVIGSHNFTRNAFATNVEASVIVDIPPSVTRFRELFDNLWQI